MRECVTIDNVTLTNTKQNRNFVRRRSKARSKQHAKRKNSKMAERVGFEPTEPVKVQHLSRVLLSATQPPLHIVFAKFRRKR